MDYNIFEELHFFHFKGETGNVIQPSVSDGGIKQIEEAPSAIPSHLPETLNPWYSPNAKNLRLPWSSLELGQLAILLPRTTFCLSP